jgi:hypothetical protein
MKSNDDQYLPRPDSFPAALLGTAESGREDPTAAIEPMVAPPSPMPQRMELFAHRRRPRTTSHRPVRIVAHGGEPLSAGLRMAEFIMNTS